MSSEDPLPSSPVPAGMINRPGFSCPGPAGQRLGAAGGFGTENVPSGCILL